MNKAWICLQGSVKLWLQYLRKHPWLLSGPCSLLPKRGHSIPDFLSILFTIFFFFSSLRSIINCTKESATFYLQFKIRCSPLFISNENHSQSREKKNIHCSAVNNKVLIPFQLFSTCKKQELAHNLTYSANEEAISLGKQNLGFPMMEA